MSGGVSGKADASDEDDDNEFFDAMEEPAEFITVPADPKYHRYKLIFSIVRRFFFLHMCFVLYLTLILFYRRSGSNISGISSETGTDDQSVNVR